MVNDLLPDGSNVTAPLVGLVLPTLYRAHVEQKVIGIVAPPPVRDNVEGSENENPPPMLIKPCIFHMAAFADVTLTDVVVPVITVPNDIFRCAVTELSSCASTTVDPIPDAVPTVKSAATTFRTERGMVIPIFMAEQPRMPTSPLARATTDAMQRRDVYWPPRV